MSAVAPPPPPPVVPRPGPTAPPEPEALIEEARDRARRRRRRRAGAILVLATAAGVVGLALAWQRGTAGAGTADGDPKPLVASRPPAGVIALTTLSGSTPSVALWTPRGVQASGIRGLGLGWSPDGIRLLVQRGSALYAVDVTTRREVLLTRHGSGFNAAWSPDGTRVVFEAGPVPRNPSTWRRIVVVGADGRDPRLLPGWALDGGFFTGNVVWSHDGRNVVFAGRTATNPRHGLYAVAADGRSSPRPLPIPAAADPAQPTFSPDGSRLAFADSGSGSIGDLVIADLDGGTVLRIDGGSGLAWSPDGTMLAYRNHGDGATWVVRADGTRKTRLPRASWSGLSWSPDSRYVAYAGGSSHEPNGDIYVVHPDGTGNHRIAHGRGRLYGLPLWRYGSTTTEAG